MIKALERIVASSNTRQQKKFSKFLQALIEANHEHVAEELKKVFDKAGQNNFVTGDFPKVRKTVVYSNPESKDLGIPAEFSNPLIQGLAGSNPILGLHD